MIWLMVILKIYLEEQLLIKYYVMEHFILPKVLDMIDIKKVFDKKTAGGTVKNEIMQNKELGEKLHKAIIRKFGERKVHSSVIDNIWGADLVDMQLLMKFNIGINFL